MPLLWYGENLMTRYSCWEHIWPTIKTEFEDNGLFMALKEQDTKMFDIHFDSYGDRGVRCGFCSRIADWQVYISHIDRLKPGESVSKEVVT